MAKNTQQTGNKGKNNPAAQQQAEPTNTAVAKKAAEAMPAHLAGLMEGDADKGTSKDLADNIVPLIYLLQPLSPQVTKGSPEHIPGAEAGDIWFRGTKTVVKGDVGIVVQLCHFSKCVNEWQPNRGGYAGRHDTMPEGAVQILDPKDERGKRKIWKTSKDKDANDLVESREHVVLVREGFDRVQPFVIPMSGSQHTSARGWMMSANQKQIPGSDKTPAIWSCLYRMKTKHNSDGTFNWYGWDISDASEDGTTKWVETAEDYAAGKKLFSDFNTGALKADDANDMNDHGARDADGDDDGDDSDI
jgi:hypothetical protein